MPCVVKTFISDDATVVVGTVIDSDMTDELRVTVIVTGLGETQQRTMHNAPQQKGRLADAMRLDGSLDYSELERPAVMRKHPATPVLSSTFKKVSEAVPDVDYLEIPAFLRRQEETTT